MGGRSVGLVGTDARIRQVGPALVVLELQSAFGRIVLMQSISPRDPYTQCLDTVMYASPDIFNFTIICRLMLYAYAENVERDVFIWNRKRFLAR